MSRIRYRDRLGRAAAATVVGLALTATPAVAATITVTTTFDELAPNDHLCSLREAISAVDAPGTAGDCGTSDSSGNTIVLPVGDYRLLINPTGGDGNATGNLNVSGNATIAGAGRTKTTIDASQIGDSVLQVGNQATATLSNLTITGGHQFNGADGVGTLSGHGENGANGGDGGGIENDGNLTVQDVAVVNNSAGSGGAGAPGPDNPNSGGTGGAGGNGGSGGTGGGILNSAGTLTVIDSTISGNHAGSAGKGGNGGAGGKETDPMKGGGASGNGGAGGAGGVGEESGGGIADQCGAVIVTGSTITGNFAGSGGAGGDGGFAYLGGHGGKGGVAGAGSWGGGVSIIGGQNFCGTQAASLSITNSTVSGNGPGGGGKGGNGGSSEASIFTNSGEQCLGGTGGDGGNGGDAGDGGGVRVTSAPSSLLNATAAANAVGSLGSGGSGGGGTCLAGGMDIGTNGTAGGNGSAGSGGSLFVQGPPSMTLENSIVSGNGTGGNCSGSITAAGHDDLSFGDMTCPGPLYSDPQLGPLQDNGGPTQTMDLGTGSPAIDTPGGDSDCPAIDQRGASRPQAAGCDLGAYERANPAAVTGGSSGIGTDHATIAGTVTANQADAAVGFEYGETTAYGSQTAIQHIAGVEPSPVMAQLTGLKPGTTYHYRVDATSVDGSQTGSDQTFTTKRVGPAITHFAETHRVWRAGSKRPFIRHPHKPPVGTTFSFTLDQAATVRIAFTRRVGGRKVGGRCTAPGRGNRHNRRCTRMVTIATIMFAGHPGVNRLGFNGHVSKRLTLPLGRYIAVITARNSAGASHPRVLAFKVV